MSKNKKLSIPKRAAKAPRRTKLIVGNWKMNPLSLLEAQDKFRQIKKGLARLKSTKIEVVICPPFVYLVSVSNIKSKGLKIFIGAQDVFYESEGAFTGEISAPMLKNLGVKYVILGHSERRALGETNEIVAQKISACLKFNLIPIVCVGESVHDESGNYLSFVKTQLAEIFQNISQSALAKIIIAYEPIWAIGKMASREATVTEVQEMAIFIRKVLSDLYDPKSVQQVKILYGGSVNPKNTVDFLKNGRIDGLLIGRDSLDPVKFSEIIKLA